ncbi:MAG: chromosomal replication initiator protein DnaA [Acidimicrobiia bacterium]|nr:chromosomal replication initiator protein DnaA [Acidimicrobiia bacterium]
MADALAIWNAASEVLRREVSDAVWMSTFAEVVPDDHPDGLVLAVPNRWTKERIEERFLDVVRAALADVGTPAAELVVEIRPGAGAGGHRLAADGGVAPVEAVQHSLDLSGPGAGVAVNSGDTGPRLETLNPKYTFDAFVIGSSNRFAHAAALAVAERPALAYNPLFIYGDAGLGKTHLLQAVAHFVRENYPNFLIRYVSSETFLNDYVESIRNRTYEAFRRKYRATPDVLLVDDIQFVEGKEGFQDELFHTFNALYETSRQIVLTSDRSPDHIATLEDRLRTRFKWGLITDIQPPDLETRLAILRKKAERETTPVPHDVLEFIAESITDNIRELEGALTRVAAFATLTKEPLSADMARRVLADILTERQPRQITPQVVLEVSAKLFGIDVEDLTGKARTRDLVDARHIAMYVCRQLTNPALSFPQIAKAFGGRDHTTVMNAVQRIERDMKERRKTFDRVNELSLLVRNGE